MKSFEIRLSDKKRGRGRFCSKSCAASGKNNSSYKHGNATRSGQTKEYRTWASVKDRTTNRHAQNYKYYGGRGVTMYDGWLNNYQSFLEHVGKAPSEKHELDRIDNDGNYEPNNVRWATRKQQMANRRSSKFIEFRGQRKTQEEWGEITGIGGTNICKRLKRGWSVEKALTKPLATIKTISKNY